jgi:DNA modification methylase
LTKGNHFFRKQICNPRRLNSIWQLLNKKDNHEHTATFTLIIPEICITAVMGEEGNENTLICDPCCGSGTTALAAANKGYKFIGLDLSQQYVISAK